MKKAIKKNVSRYNMATDKKLMSEKKMLASTLLDAFQWSDEQKFYLNKIKANGYVVAPYNKVATAFKKINSKNGDQKSIVTISMNGTKIIKKNIFIYTL